jgi:hypothetical protein
LARLDRACTKSTRPKLSVLSSQEARYPTHSSAILREARQLHNVSERLDSLAEQHPVISERLITISGNVCHTAVLLEVLVATKMGPPTEPGPAGA